MTWWQPRYQGRDRAQVKFWAGKVWGFSYQVSLSGHPWKAETGASQNVLWLSVIYLFYLWNVEIFGFLQNPPRNWNGDFWCKMCSVGKYLTKLPCSALRIASFAWWVCKWTNKGRMWVKIIKVRSVAFQSRLAKPYHTSQALLFLLSPLPSVRNLLLEGENIQRVRRWLAMDKPPLCRAVSGSLMMGLGLHRTGICFSVSCVYLCFPQICPDCSCQLRCVILPLPLRIQKTRCTGTENSEGTRARCYCQKLCAENLLLA